MSGRAPRPGWRHRPVRVTGFGGTLGLRPHFSGVGHGAHAIPPDHRGDRRLEPAGLAGGHLRGRDVRPIHYGVDDQGRQLREHGLDQVAVTPPSACPDHYQPQWTDTPPYSCQSRKPDNPTPGQHTIGDRMHRAFRSNCLTDHRRMTIQPANTGNSSIHAASRCTPTTEGQTWMRLLMSWRR